MNQFGDWTDEEFNERMLMPKGVMGNMLAEMKSKSVEKNIRSSNQMSPYSVSFNIYKFEFVLYVCLRSF